MPETELTEPFIKQYQNLPSEIKKKIKKALRLLAENPRHHRCNPNLSKVQAGIYEARVDQRYRITYERLSSDVLRMRGVGKQDEVLRVL
jgi:mRNA-degrading endonuclease RelE of RelBE toxin-antitoxin system